MKSIAIIGGGYVGLSLATLLSSKNLCTIIDVNANTVDLINKRISPINDAEIEEWFKNKKLNLTATLDVTEQKDADYIIIAVPTNYDDKKNYFDVSILDSVIKNALTLNNHALIVIKSTVPIGYTEKTNQQYRTNRIVFSPEFLRESKALYDNLYPSRLVVGANASQRDDAKMFAELLGDVAEKKDIPTLIMNPTEAESVKLFANTYLALRVAYFNELDTFAEIKGLNTKDIIEGVCLDPRIGMYYNNQSFGYGGYCLPKDTKQILANYKDIPQNMIEAIVKSNKTRKQHIADMVLERNPSIVGIYRLIMKSGSDNFRASAIQDVMELLRAKGVELVVYEPTLKEDKYNGFNIEHDLATFKERCDIILANRMDDLLNDIKAKIYTSDIYSKY